MRSREDIEAYLLRLGLPYDEVSGKDMWIVRDASRNEWIVVSLAEELVLFRVKVLDLENAKKKDELFRLLLEINANEMIHGAYGIAGGAVVLTCTLRIENLDYSEFQGTIDDFSVALTKHYETLSRFRDE
jgi:hypothetical protein